MWLLLKEPWALVKVVPGHEIMELTMYILSERKDNQPSRFGFARKENKTDNYFHYSILNKYDVGWELRIVGMCIMFLRCVILTSWTGHL